ncbi:MAG: DUF2076 domain-containing protein [Acidobacteriaceae bacterium]|nr:DUF2076 domain-containing protein [Acidobacteriaceae bacterium]
MTPDERKMLTDLADRFAQTPAPPKDAEAEEFIRTRIGSRPDALYLMTQTVLIQNLALQNAQRQIQDLQQRSAQPVPASSGSSFLGQQQAPPRSSGYSGSQYSQSGGQQQSYAPPPPPQYAPMPAPSGAPSFLRGAAQTAAGVAAGALAFEAINSLFSHPGYGGGGFGGFGGSGFMGGASPVEETVVNNYYDSPREGERGDYREDHQNVDDARDLQDGRDLQNVDDSNQFDDSAQFEDASYDTGDDGGSFDDNSGGDNYV